MPILLSQKNKNIGIFGLGRTGMSAYESVKDVATRVICYDELEASREAFIQKFGVSPIVDITDPRWKSLDKIILSPGIPLTHEIVEIASSNNIAITSDIDLLFEECKKANFIGITGTNGKSTTTALIGHILQSVGLNYAVGGNIGIPVLSMPFDSDGYVLELSSFQLDMLSSFKAKIAVLLNITPDHLDRHHTMAGYAAAKKKIFDRMDKDTFAIIGVDNNLSKAIFHELEQENRMNLIPISTKKIVDKGVAVLDNKIYDNIFEQIIIDLPVNKYLQGAHNKRENIAASYAACRALKVASAQIVTAINTFQGLPHRMQYIGAIKGISFYNDSKATNSEAASKSISALDNIYWLAGGVAKEGGIEGLQPWFNKIKKAYLFGKDKEMFAKTLDRQVSYQIFETLEQAFNAAFEDVMQTTDNKRLLSKLAYAEGFEGDSERRTAAYSSVREDEGYESTYKSPAEVVFRKKSNILLAPACASLDQFKSFEQRGDAFIKLCHEKISNHG